MEGNEIVDTLRLMGKPACYYSVLGRSLNNSAAGLFLNYIIFDQPKVDSEGWFSLSESRISEVVGIGRFELITVKHVLTTKKILEVDGLRFRVHWNQLSTLIGEYTETAEITLLARKNKDLKGTVVGRMGSIFVQKYSLYKSEEYILNEKDYGQLKYIKSQLEARAKKKEAEPTTTYLLDSWVFIMENIPKNWHKTLSPAVIYSNFSTILNQIADERKKNEKPKSFADAYNGGTNKQ